MYQSVVAMFPTRQDAMNARDALLRAGIEDSHIVIRSADDNDTSGTRTDTTSSSAEGGGFLDWLFGSDVPEEHQTAYRSGMQGGHTICSVKTIDSEDEYHRVSDIFERSNAINVNEEGGHYSNTLGGYHPRWDDRDSASGTTGLGTETGSGLGSGRYDTVGLSGGSAGTATHGGTLGSDAGLGATGAGLTADSPAIATDRTTPVLDEPATPTTGLGGTGTLGTTHGTETGTLGTGTHGETGTLGTGTGPLGTAEETGTLGTEETGRLGTGGTTTTDETVIPVAKEELQVGKRQVRSAKAYRIRTVVSEVPVEQNVQLRDETVSVEHRPATGTTTAGDPFQEKVVEVHETHEEPTVEKVVTGQEEVVVRKEATEHTETVRDTVRETHVETEDAMAGNRPTTESNVTSGTGVTDTGLTDSETSRRD